MNKKAELFNQYLEERKITAFQVEEIADDQLNSVVFRSRITVEGAQLPTIIILDSSSYAVIRVQVASQALKDSNKLALYEAIDSMNGKYKVFKYYFAPDGSLILDSVILQKPGELDGNMIYTILDVIIKHLEAEYKNIMKSIWA